MSTPNGTFVWYELLTSDAAAAQTFYGAVMGWGAQLSGHVPERGYTILSAGAMPVAGLMALPAEACAAGARPGWMGYLAVHDVDATVARIHAAGGRQLRAPEDIPQVGRFAVVADPQGAPFALIRGLSDQPPPSVAGGTPGHAGWHELHAADGPSAFAFYADQFGWTRDVAMDMGPRGVYQLFATGGSGPAVGGMLTRDPAGLPPVPLWLFYFNVADVDAAQARVLQHGGQVLHGPHQVPGGSWILHGLDPQGALFALVGPRPTRA